jgi:hypothetical protein
MLHVGTTGIKEEEDMRNDCDQNGSKGPNFHTDVCERGKKSISRF